MARKCPFMWCCFLVEMLTQNVHISPRICHFRSNFQKIKTIFMCRSWAFSQTLEEFFKNSNPFQQSFSHFSKLFHNKPPQHCTYVRARRVMSKYRQVILAIVKFLLQICFCKRRGLPRLWRNLPIWVKIARFNPFFLMKVTILKA